MADPIVVMTAMLIGVTAVGTPILGGIRVIPKPDKYNEVVHEFRMPPTPCGSADCIQNLLEIREDKTSCAGYQNMRIINVDSAPIRMPIDEKPGVIRINSMGDASGHKFIFRASVIERCAPAS